jgi:putative ABC transport system substrate-binding protein
MELLHQLVPNAKVIALLLNPNNTNADLETNDSKVAAHALGLELVLVKAGGADDIDKAFASLAELHVGGLLISGDVLFNARREHIAELALRAAVPTSFASRTQAEAGGLMSYGARIADTYRQTGDYVGRVLKGEKPADLPVMEPTKFEFVINMKTAKTLGLDVPHSMQVLADEVIE